MALSAIAANTLLNEILQEFTAKAAEIPLKKHFAVIGNVGFQDLIYLFGIMQKQNRQIYLPGEIGNENLTIIYTPCPGCTIAIESEPAIDYRWKVKYESFCLN